MFRYLLLELTQPGRGWKGMMCVEVTGKNGNIGNSFTPKTKIMQQKFCPTKSLYECVHEKLKNLGYNVLWYKQFILHYTSMIYLTY